MSVTAQRLSADQQSAVDRIRRFFRTDCHRGCQQLTLGGYAGTGKTSILTYLWPELREMGACVMAPTGKAANVLFRKGIDRVSTVHSLIYLFRGTVETYQGNEKPVFDDRGDDDWGGGFSPRILVCDECFVGSTLIDTPSGLRRIDSLRPGDEVLNCTGIDRVLACKKKELDYGCRIVAGNTAITSSTNHPFFTDRGWVVASELRPGDTILKTDATMRLVREGYCGIVKNSAASILRRSLYSALESEIRSDIRQGPKREGNRTTRQAALSFDRRASGRNHIVANVPGPEQAASHAGSAVRSLRKKHSGWNERSVSSLLLPVVFGFMAGGKQSEVSREIHARVPREASRWPICVPSFRFARSPAANGSNQELVSDEQRRISQESISDVASNGPQAARPRRQWENDSPADSLARNVAGFRAGVNRENGHVAILSDTLQARSWMGDCENIDRTGWDEPSQPEGEGAGCEEGWILEGSRVESVEVLESRDPRMARFRDADGKLYFYDLQVERHPSYSVEGHLVHNSSMVSSDLHGDIMARRLPVLWVGDHGQLPPVGGDPGIMHDPDIRLEKIHRQAEGNPILELAAHVRQGGTVTRDFADGDRLKVGGILDDKRLVRYALDNGIDQVIVGVNGKTVDQYGSRHKLNRLFREALGRKNDLDVGDRIICTFNSRRNGIFNGQIFRVDAIFGATPTFYECELSAEMPDGWRTLPRTIKVQRASLGNPEYRSADRLTDCCEFDFGYGITCHKSQGDQWRRVLVVDKAVHAFDMNRWRYTGFTRAAEHLSVVIR